MFENRRNQQVFLILFLEFFGTFIWMIFNLHCSISEIMAVFNDSRV